MPFTGQLGTADSQLGQFELASAGSAATPTQTIQLRANILGVSTQGLQMRARIRFPEQTLDMRARIRGAKTLDMRAKILGFITSAPFAIEYDVLNTIQERLLIRFDATDKDRNFKTIKMRARIQAQVSAGLTISYDVNYTMPTNCVVTRPTQRATCRVVRTFSARARLTNG